jgi:hypothetical protein
VIHALTTDPSRRSTTTSTNSCGHGIIEARGQEVDAAIAELRRLLAE